MINFTFFGGNSEENSYNKIIVSYSFICIQCWILYKTIYTQYLLLGNRGFAKTFSFYIVKEKYKKNFGIVHIWRAAYSCLFWPLVTQSQYVITFLIILFDISHYAYTVECLSNFWKVQIYCNIHFRELHSFLKMWLHIWTTPYHEI